MGIHVYIYIAASLTGERISIYCVDTPRHMCIYVYMYIHTYIYIDRWGYIYIHISLPVLKVNVFPYTV